MRLNLQGLLELNPPWRNCVITMGNFDGLHKGHQKLIEKIQQEAQKSNITPVVLTFEKKNPGDGDLLFTPEEKELLLQNSGIQYKIQVEMDESLKNLEAHDFLREILIDRLKAKVIVIGYDHRFGKHRKGDFDFLKKHEEEFGYKAYRIDAIEDGEEIVSSSRIRNLILKANLPEANRLLLRPFFISSPVVHGDKRGKIIGFPTANLVLKPEKIPPPAGVYLTYVSYRGQLYKSLTNIGSKPTFSGKVVNAETHILNFNREIYDEEIIVYFIQKIRNEIHFSGPEELQAQIRRDIDSIKELEFTFS